MFRRMTLLVPLLAILTLSGCLFFPPGGGHGGGPGGGHGGGPGPGFVQPR